MNYSEGSTGLLASGSVSATGELAEYARGDSVFYYNIGGMEAHRIYALMANCEKVLAKLAQERLRWGVFGKPVAPRAHAHIANSFVSAVDDRLSQLRERVVLNGDKKSLYNDKARTVLGFLDIPVGSAISFWYSRPDSSPQRRRGLVHRFAYSSNEAYLRLWTPYGFRNFSWKYMSDTKYASSSGSENLKVRDQLLTLRVRCAEGAATVEWRVGPMVVDFQSYR